MTISVVKRQKYLKKNKGQRPIFTDKKQLAATVCIG